MKNRWATAGFILLFLAISAYILSGIMSVFTSEDIEQGNVIVIPIKGIITTDDGVSMWNEEYTSSTNIVKLLDQIESNTEIQAVVLDINSPGGGAVSSYEIMNRLLKMEKPVVSVIREVGASGAYWIASASDYIISSPLSSVGSIGVFSSYIEYSGLMKDFNVTYQRFVSGEYKDAGIPYRKPTPEEVAMRQNQIDKVRDFFMKSVGENRVIEISKMREISEGQIFLGDDAVELGLVDALGSFDTAEEYLKLELNQSISFRYHKEKTSFFDIFDVSVQSGFFKVGEGIAHGMLKENNYNVLRT
jgi:protease-4